MHDYDEHVFDKKKSDKKKSDIYSQKHVRMVTGRVNQPRKEAKKDKSSS